MWKPLAGLMTGVAIGALSGERLTTLAVAAEELSHLALIAVAFLSGITIGAQQQIFTKLRRRTGIFTLLLLPLASILGSLGGGIGAGWAFGRTLSESVAVSGGMCYYSLAFVMLQEWADTEIAALAFLCGVLRETLALLITPAIARWLGRTAAIAPAGSTSMDVLLPVIARCTDSETAVMAAVHGAICTAAVPIILTLAQYLP